MNTVDVVERHVFVDKINKVTTEKTEMRGHNIWGIWVYVVVSGEQAMCGWRGMAMQSSGSFKTISYLPTPPLGQDITQGQFLSGV